MFGSLALMLLLAVPAQTPEAGPSPKAERKDRLEEMRGLARGVTAESGDGEKLTLSSEPIYRFADPARDHFDGTVWTFGKSGRPEALLSLALEERKGVRLKWLYEFASLSNDRVRAVGPAEVGPWEPEDRAIAFRPIPKTDAPDVSAPKRLRQMRDIALRFQAHEFFELTAGGPPQRYELRLLSQPVVRYQDPASGLIDGGLFFLAYGQNPEVVLIIEAQDKGTTGWHYAAERLSAAELHLRLDDQDVVQMPRVYDAGVRRRYAGFVRSVTDVEKP